MWTGWGWENGLEGPRGDRLGFCLTGLGSQLAWQWERLILGRDGRGCQLPEKGELSEAYWTGRGPGQDS